MASEADNQLHRAVSKAPKMISHPRAVDDILQVFFEINYDYYLQWRVFRFTSPSRWTCIRRISEWFREHLDILLEFRRLVLLYPGVSVPIPYNFGELVRIEAIYGGRIDLDAKLLSEASDDHILPRRMKLGFNLLYDISYDHYLEIFRHAPADVMDTLNKRADVRLLPHWTTDQRFCTSACPHDQHSNKIAPYLFLAYQI